MNQIILIDGSYFVFYRFHAIKMWWSKARKPEEPEDPREATRFIDTFKSTFYKKLFALEKKHNITNPIRYVAKDCSRKNIWRMKLYPTYKMQRKSCNEVGFFMKLAYEELFCSPTIHTILKHNSLEADDCVGITATHLINTQPNSHVWIIANDHDYLQLQHSNISLINLQGKFLTDTKHCLKEKQLDLLYKIICGDKSDNIPSVFTRCGSKTAKKYVYDLELFNKKLNESSDAKERFERNKTLIDFCEIPENLSKEFKQTYIELFSNS